MNNETLAIIAIALAITLAAGLITIGTSHLALATYKKKTADTRKTGPSTNFNNQQYQSSFTI